MSGNGTAETAVRQDWPLHEGPAEFTARTITKQPSCLSSNLRRPLPFGCVPYKVRNLKSKFPLQMSGKRVKI